MYIIIIIVYNNYADTYESRDSQVNYNSCGIRRGPISCRKRLREKWPRV